jgi:hypothetical protein
MRQNRATSLSGKHQRFRKNIFLIHWVRKEYGAKNNLHAVTVEK